MFIRKRVHAAVEDRYELLRQESRDAALAGLPAVMTNSAGQGINIRGEVSLTALDSETFREVSRWASSPQRKADISISWPHLIAKYSRIAPKRFELGIWHRDILCGIALGQPTLSGGKLRLDFLEGSPEKTPMNGLITPITVVALIYYAVEIGASQIRIMNPVNKRVRDHYLQPQFGFSYDEIGDFCFRNL